MIKKMVTTIFNVFLYFLLNRLISKFQDMYINIF